MGKARAFRILILLAGILAGSAYGNDVQARTVEVWPGGPVPSIQAALNQAQHGDTIRVHPGTYQEKLRIDKSVALVGVEMPVIDGGGFGDVITVLADGVTIKGFEIIGSGKMLEDSDSGLKIKSHNNIIEDNRIVNNLFGIYLERSTGNVIRRNLIRGRPVIRDYDSVKVDDDNPYAGYHPSFAGEGGDGIHLFDSPENLIEYNVITDCRDGIYFDYSDHNRVNGNHIYGVRYGIHYMYSWYNTFEDNLLTHNVAGAAPMFSKYIVFRNNVMAYSRGHRSYGILFATCDYSLAEGNIVIDNTRGIFCDVSMHNIFRRNLIARNDVGLDLISSSSDNLFIENNFIDNLQHVSLVANRVGENFFFDHEKGNYWSDYRGFDLDRDGIGDIPHYTGDPFTYLMSKAPAVRLFLNSPAATALEFSERMFPVISIPKVEDRFPLIEQVDIQIPDFAGLGAQANNRMLGAYSLAMLLLGLGIYRHGLSLGRGWKFKLLLVRRGETGV